MGRNGKCISDDDSKAIKKSLKKFSKREIASFNDRLRGSFTIVGFRKYQFTNEVDIEFNGEICARHSSLAVLTWFKSDIYNQKSVSKNFRSEENMNLLIPKCRRIENKTNSKY